MTLKLKKYYISIGIVVCAIYLYPLIWAPLINDGQGIYDWDHVSQRYAAIYQTVVNYKQLPGNNIWLGGGLPLAQTYSAYGIFGVLTLLFGVKVGIYLSILTYYIIGYFGSIKLAELFTEDRLRQVLFAMYVIFSNALAYHMEVGHLQFVNILVVPYVIYLSIKTKETFQAILLGLIVGVSFLDGPVYTGQYIFVLTMIILFARLYVNKDRKNIIIYIVMFLMAYISAILYKVFGLLQLFNEFPRVTHGITNYNIMNWFEFSFWPAINNAYVDIDSDSCRGTWENKNYLGVTSLLLLVNLAYKRPRYIGYMIIFLVAAYSNDTQITDFNYYLKMVPTFNSHLCTARIRLFSPILMGVIILIAYNEANLLKVGGVKLQINMLLLIMVFEVGVASFLVLKNSHQYSERQAIEVNQNFVSIRQEQLLGKSLTDATLSNIGVNDVYESYVPVMANKDIVDDSNEEYTQAGRAIKPIYWSPNRIVFGSMDLENCIKTKIHISKNWRINDQYIYSDRKSYEPEELICAKPDETGRLVMNYEVNNSNAIIFLNLLLLTCLGYVGLRDYGRRVT